jgi:hypothetical protein
MSRPIALAAAAASQRRRLVKHVLVGCLRFMAGLSLGMFGLLVGFYISDR